MQNRICRNCGHTELRHIEEGIERCGWVSQFLDIAYQYEFCPCHKFVPEDNLEYLELKVKQKEAEKLSL